MAQSGRYKQVSYHDQGTCAVKGAEYFCLKVYNFCTYIYRYISFLFQYRRYMKNHGPDRMTFDDS